MPLSIEANEGAADMNFWQFLDRVLGRMPGWPDTRGWIVLGLFSQCTLIIYLIASQPKLAELDLFKLIAQGLIIQALIGLALAYFFTATQTGSELVKRQGKIAEAAMQNMTDQRDDAVDELSDTSAAGGENGPVKLKGKIEGTITGGGADDTLNLEMEDALPEWKSTPASPPAPMPGAQRSLDETEIME